VADDAGALLVRSGLIDTDALILARALVQSEGGTMGEHLVATDLLSDDALTEFYRTRLLVPQVNPNTLARLPDEVVASIPADMAIDLRVIPVALGDGITLAMSDPSSRVAVDEVSAFTGTYVVRSVATQMQIAWCLAHYYGHVTALGQRLLDDGARAAGPVAQDRSELPDPPVAAPRRSRGLTSKVNAARHRAVPPITAPIIVARPDPSQLDDPRPIPERISSRAGSSDSGNHLRVRTVTGEISVAEVGEVIVTDADDLDSGPVVTIEVSEALRPIRRSPHWQDPPELATRSGEVESRSNRAHNISSEPAVVIASEVFEAARERSGPDPDLGLNPALVGSGQVAEFLDDSESAPILLESKRPTVDLRNTSTLARATARQREQTQPPTDSGVPRAIDGDENSGVVLLAQPKLSGSRPAVEVPGPAPAVPEPPRIAAPQPPQVASARPPAKRQRPERRTQLGLGIESVPAVPLAPASRAARDTEVTAPVRSEPASPPAATAPSIHEQVSDRTADRAAARLPSYSEAVDDGWGPPGSTIPPPWLGAIPGGIASDGIPGATIPLSDLSGPLLIAAPLPPQNSGRPSANLTIPGDEDLVAALEVATSRVRALVQLLDQADERDQIIDLLVQHLAESHSRAGFFTIRQSVLTAFRFVPQPPLSSTASLRLDSPSTFQDVVDTRLPYRGPVDDTASRQFLLAILGEVPTEILLVPVSVRQRAVGVLFADGRNRHTFDEQLAEAARAAGVALQRAVLARRPR
jgi:Type II secretion system (T2SS), protein E, N-terminal domain